MSGHNEFGGGACPIEKLVRLLAPQGGPSLGERTVRFAYTSTGKRASMEDAGGTTTYTYPNQDRLKP